MWSRLRNRQVQDLKFVRQFPIGPYFADFVCRERWLVVELDGRQHQGSHHDQVRTRFLNAQGYSVLRFWNTDVLTNTDGVLTTLSIVLNGGDAPDGRYHPAPVSATIE